MSSSLGRVLVVDDDDVIRQLITVNLELEGFEVATAVDGQDCLDKVKDVRPDVITLDIMMPRLDGWEAASRLRADPDTAAIKVVLLSARAQEADLARGSRIGVDAYLTKPFDPDELIEVVRHAGRAAPGRDRGQLTAARLLRGRARRVARRAAAGAADGLRPALRTGRRRRRGRPAAGRWS